MMLLLERLCKWHWASLNQESCGSRERNFGTWFPLRRPQAACQRLRTSVWMSPHLSLLESSIRWLRGGILNYFVDPCAKDLLGTPRIRWWCGWTSFSSVGEKVKPGKLRTDTDKNLNLISLFKTLILFFQCATLFFRCSPQFLFVIFQC